MKKNVMPLALANALFFLDAATGLLRWRAKPSYKVDAGSVAGTINSNGYRIIAYDKVRFRASGIVFSIANGRTPLGEIDHINGRRGDDRPTNLREATRAQNNQNIAPQANNKLGVKGVIRTASGRYLASICKHGKQTNLGRYDTVAEASAAYEAAAREYQGEFYRDAH